MSAGPGRNGSESPIWKAVAIALLGSAVARVIGNRRGQAARPLSAASHEDERAGVRVAPVEEPGPGLSGLKRRFDLYQRRRPVLGFAVGVVKKFGEDRAGSLAALVAYFGFFSIFPLMLAFTSMLGFVLDDPEDQQKFSDAAADQIPVIGDTIRDTAGQLEGSVVAVVVGILVALWAGLRIVDAMQRALNDVWDLPRTTRPNILVKRIRGALMLGLIGGGLAASVAASNIASLVDVMPWVARYGIWVASAIVSVLLYILSFQLLTNVRIPWRHLLPGAVFGGLAWWALQTFGSVYIIEQQEAAGEAFGEFASIIALLAFLFLAAQMSILGAEMSAVWSQKLWPRSLTKGDFTPADLVAFERLAAATQQDESYVVKVEPRHPDAAGGGPRR